MGSSLASVMGTEASTELIVTKGLMEETQSSGGSDKETLLKALDSIKSTISSNLEPI